MTRFHGSYRAQDVEFLLKPIPVTMIEDTREKERLIQSGQRHYSEMLTPEKLPSEQYRRLFHEALDRNRERMARDCLTLAQLILRHAGDRPTLVSLARAGTPVGAILVHLLRGLTGHAVAHYSVSIIRDRGIDANALDTILERGAAPESIVFIDGWTGKGVICDELHQAVSSYNRSRGTNIPPHLYVLADLAGKAFCAATADDYLIPSSILNSTISGLVSRSILNDAIGPGDYHGCVYFTEFAEHDLSVWFVDEILRAVDRLQPQADQPVVLDRQGRAHETFIVAEMARYGITDRNLIKPGIGEATRVLLRRLPERLIVRDRTHIAVRHLIALADEKGVTVEERPDLPLNAISIIRSVFDA
ncbi:MAG: cysteine protease StiP family protein [Betaproteobacteria bacterium]|nr:cysteine protease StiP family protein [Betaproteobacteria bacterium]